MRDSNRIPIIMNKLQKLWMDNPDMRLGQLIRNITSENAIRIGLMEDGIFERTIDKMDICFKE